MCQIDQLKVKLTQLNMGAESFFAIYRILRELFAKKRRVHPTRMCEANSPVTACIIVTKANLVTAVRVADNHAAHI